MGHFGTWNRAVGAGFAILALFGSAIAGQAQGRPDTRAFACEEARAFIRQNGAAVMTTGRYTYDRFVADERFCPSGMIGERAYVATQDAQDCPIGYRCVTDSRDDDFFRRLPPRSR